MESQAKLTAVLCGDCKPCSCGENGHRVMSLYRPQAPRSTVQQCAARCSICICKESSACVLSYTLYVHVSCMGCLIEAECRIGCCGALWAPRGTVQQCAARCSICIYKENSACVLSYTLYVHVSCMGCLIG